MAPRSLRTTLLLRTICKQSYCNWNVNTGYDKQKPKQFKGPLIAEATVPFDSCQAFMGYFTTVHNSNAFLM